MTRYYTLRRTPRTHDDWQWYDEPPKVAATTVHEPSEQHLFSGLLNADGEPLFKAAMNPIGFLAQFDD